MNEKMDEVKIEEVLYKLKELQEWLTKLSLSFKDEVEDIRYEIEKVRAEIAGWKK